MNDNYMKTGTTTVGIVGKDCVILAADKRATAGNFIADKRTDKVVAINDRLAITTAGTVSEIQLLIKIIRAELALKTIRYDRDSRVKEAANFVAGLVYGSIRRYSLIPGVVHFLLGGTNPTGDVELYDIYPDGSVTRIEDYVTSGSGGTIALGVLESRYKKDLSAEEAADIALMAVTAAMSRDSASGDGIDVFVISKEGVRKHISKKVKASLVE